MREAKEAAQEFLGIVLLQNARAGHIKWLSVRLDPPLADEHSGSMTLMWERTETASKSAAKRITPLVEGITLPFESGAFVATTFDRELAPAAGRGSASIQFDVVA
jgi:hypothetical protein